MFKIKAEVPTIKEYIELRLALWLSRKSEEAARLHYPIQFMELRFITVKKVGISRIIGDGGCIRDY